MSSFLCFVCHSTVNADTHEETREKYREVIGMNLCPDSHLCYICCYFLHKMWMFKSICLKRSLEYPVLFSEKGTINLHRSETSVSILCTEDICLQHLNTRYHYHNNNDNSQSDFDDSSYCQLQDDRNFDINETLLKTTENFRNEDYLFVKDADDNIFHDNLPNLEPVRITQNDLINGEWMQNVLKRNSNHLLELNCRSDVTFEGLLPVNTESLAIDNNVPMVMNMQSKDVAIECTDRSIQDVITGLSFPSNYGQVSNCVNDNISNTIFVSNHTHSNNVNIETAINKDHTTTNENVTNLNDNVRDISENIANLNENVNNLNVPTNAQVIVNNITETVADINIINNANYTMNNITDNFTDITDNAINVNDKVAEINEKVSNINEDTNANNKPAIIDDDNKVTNIIDTKITNIIDNNKVINIIDNNKVSNIIERKEDTNMNDNTSENEISSANEDEIASAEENSDADNLSTIEESETTVNKPKKRKGKDSFEKILLTVEEQKMELEKARKEEKYIAASFKCHSCAMYFHFKDSYQTHMMRHEESNGEYFCSICSLRFANPAVLRSHTANHSERYRCTTCGDAVRPRQRETHERQCAGERDSVSCHLCGLVFQCVQHFQQHVRRFHGVGSAGDVRHRCNVCGASCASRRHLRTHLITHINRKFDCDQCPSTFSSPYTLTRHKKSKHQPAEPDLHRCSACQLTYNSRKSLAQHMRTALAHKDTVHKKSKHQPAEPDLHRCSACQLTYNSRKSLAQHMRTALAHKDTVYKCASCGRVCPSLASLQAHTAALHTRPRHLACRHCNKRYSTTKALVHHMSTHKEDRQLPLCHACGVTFKNATILKKHLKNVCEKEKRKSPIIEEELLQVPFFE